MINKAIIANKNIVNKTIIINKANNISNIYNK